MGNASELLGYKKQEKLYTKNKKTGRYEEYREPQPPFDNVRYRKYVYGKKTIYEPISMCLESDLEEGVWVVTKNRYGRSFVNGRYMLDCFLCLKASDIQPVSLAKLGGMEKLADWLCCNWERIPKGESVYNLCRAIVGILMGYNENEKDGK